MQQDNRFGLVKVVMLVAALVAVNALVVLRARPVEAQNPFYPGEGDNTKCTFPMPLPGNYCEYYPGASCSIATCTETALEP